MLLPGRLSFEQWQTLFFADAERCEVAEKIPEGVLELLWRRGLERTVASLTTYAEYTRKIGGELSIEK